jgi:hypothetical protein
MFLKFIAVSLLALAGCSSMVNMQTLKVGGTGRFAQVSKDGQLIVQLDMNSLAACQAELAMISPADAGNTDVLCNTVSLSDMLPYSFTVTTIMTNSLYSTTRVKTMDACLLMYKQALKLPTVESYKLGECKQS